MGKFQTKLFPRKTQVEQENYNLLMFLSQRIGKSIGISSLWNDCKLLSLVRFSRVPDHKIRKGSFKNCVMLKGTRILLQRPGAPKYLQVGGSQMENWKFGGSQMEHYVIFEWSLISLKLQFLLKFNFNLNIKRFYSNSPEKIDLIRRKPLETH